MRAYRPTDEEPFMNERQRDYFRLKLLAWKDDILKEIKETLQLLQHENQQHPDFTDRASSETNHAIELRARDRQRKLIPKIDAALKRIEDGTYGYCEETGEPISIKRLEARPIRLCRLKRRSATNAASELTRRMIVATQGYEADEGARKLVATESFSRVCPYPAALSSTRPFFCFWSAFWRCLPLSA